MTGKIFELGVELRIIPVGLDHPRLQIVDDHGGRDATKVPERIFQTAQETLAGLSPDHFAVTLARMTQHRPKQMRASALARFDHPPSLPEIDLQLLAGRTLHPPERQFLETHPSQHKAAHGKITARKLPFDHQVLVDPLDGQALRQRSLDLFPPWLARTDRARTGGQAGLRVGG